MNREFNKVSKRAGLIKIAIDMHRKNYRVVRQLFKLHHNDKKTLAPSSLDKIP
jgi:hypothetical protein